MGKFAAVPHINRRNSVSHRPSPYGRWASVLLRCFSVPVCMFVLILWAQTQRAEAVVPGAGPSLSSIQAYKICRASGGGRFECFLGTLYIDPIGGDLSSLQLTLSYDPTHWVFDPAQSGPLCSFALAGPCPAVTAAVGTLPLASLPAPAGKVIPGSSLSLSASGGIVSLDYTLPSPVSVPSDMNVFALTFDAVVPFLPAPATATYFDTPGNYDFTQLSFSCGNVICGSDTPINGLNLSVVPAPEPPAIWILALPLAILGIPRLFRVHVFASRQTVSS